MSEKSATVEYRLGPTPETTEVIIHVQGDLSLNDQIKLQRVIMEKELPKLLPDFVACAECKSGIGKLLVRSEPRPIEREVENLRKKVDLMNGLLSEALETGRLKDSLALNLKERIKKQIQDPDGPVEVTLRKVHY